MSRLSSKLRQFKAAWAARRAYKRVSKEISTMGLPQTWIPEKSATKAAVSAGGAAKGAAVGGGGAAGLLAWIRSMWPGALPWDVSLDPAIVAVAGLIGGPVWAWLQTFLRDKAAHGGGQQGVIGKTLMGLALCVGASLFALTGCTTTLPGGITITPDVAAIQQLQPQLETAMTQLAIWVKEYQAAKSEKERAEAAEKLARQQQRVAALQAIIAALRTNPAVAPVGGGNAYKP